MTFIIDPDDEGRFVAAFTKLINAIENQDWQIRLAAIATVSGQWIARGDQLPWDTNSILAGVMVRIVLQHVYEGRPLALPLVVLEAYVAAGANLPTPLHECERCGYALPQSFTACPLCGGPVGFGAYNKRRARVAGCN